MAAVLPYTAVDRTLYPKELFKEGRLVYISSFVILLHKHT